MLWCCCQEVTPIVAVVQWGSWYSTGTFRESGNPGGGEIGITKASGVVTERRNGFIEISALNVPAFSTIATALIIDIQSFASGFSADIGCRIQGHDVDDSTPFTLHAQVVSAPRTTALVDFNPVLGNAFGLLIDTPDISTILQEIVDRPGWTGGNSIALFFEEHNTTAAYSDGQTTRQFPGGGIFTGTLIVTLV